MSKACQFYIFWGSVYIVISKQHKSNLAMNFLIKLFSCGQLNRSTKRNRCPSTFSIAAQNNAIQVEKGNDKDGSLTSRTKSNSSKPASSMSNLIQKKLPQTKHISLRGSFNSKEKMVNWGFLVGVVNYNPKHEQLIPNSALKVKIGRNQQINSLISIRAQALDRLVVFWSELAEDYTMNHYIRCRQPLIFVVQDWTLLLKLIEIYEVELLKTLGEFCLLESINKVFFNIISYENKYVIQFQQAQIFREYARDYVEKAISTKIMEDDLTSLFEKMTLNDYVELQKDASLMVRKLNHYLNEIAREKCQKKAAKESEEAAAKIINYDAYSEGQEEKIRKESKSSDFELQAEYFAERRKAVVAPELPHQAELNEDQNLLICYFNGSDIEESEEPEVIQPTRPTFYFRKIRSKSQDATYIPDQSLLLDDEFFQKYQ